MSNQDLFNANLNPNGGKKEEQRKHLKNNVTKLLKGSALLRWKSTTSFMF